MTDMKKKLETIRDMVKESMEAYDPTEEFGIDRDAYSQMKESVNGFFESMISRNDDSDYEYSEYSDSGESVEEPEYVDLLNNPDYEIVYEKHVCQYGPWYAAELQSKRPGQQTVSEL